MMKNTLRKLRLGVSPVLVLGLAISACVGGDDVSLDVGDRRHDPRYERLRARLGIVVRAGAQNGLSASCSEAEDAVSPCCSEEYCSPYGLMSRIYLGCDRESWVPAPAGDPADPGDKCLIDLRGMDARICAAEQLLTIVENPSERAIQVTQEGGTTILVGPQDAESNSELAVIATKLAAEAFQSARDRLAFVPPADQPLRCLAEQVDRPVLEDDPADEPITYGTFAALTYLNAIDVARQASDILVTQSTAVSDSAMSRATDRADAAFLRLAPFASRAAAAHALVGGEPGLPALGSIGENGLFSRPPLSLRGQTALELLRRAAPDPAHILSASVTTVDLVGGGALSDTGHHTLRARLARIYGEQAIALGTAADLYSRFGIDAGALEEARAWLAAEIRAFDRSVGAPGTVRPARLLGSEHLADGTESNFPIYAATRLPPQQPLDVYWSAVVRYDSTRVPFPTVVRWPLHASPQGGLPPGWTWGVESWSNGLAVSTFSAVPELQSGRTIASLIEESALGAGGLIGSLSPEPTFTENRQAVLGRMQNLIGNAHVPGIGAAPEWLDRGTARSAIAGSSLLGRAQLCAVGARFLLSLDLRYSDIDAADSLRVVLGKDGLDCAVRGHIDGDPCSADELEALRARDAYTASPFVFVATNREVEPGLNIPVFSGEVQAAPGTGPVSPLSAYYVVYSPNPATAVPGSWLPLTGFVAYPPATGEKSCIGGPIQPEMDRRVAEIIGISDSDPGRSRVDCAGLPWDLDMPLENELTDDRDDVESSWRHYLQVARSAATEADLLGEELVRVGLEMDLRAEREVDELEKLCGVRVNVTEIGGAAPARVMGVGTGCLPGYDLVPGDGTGPAACHLNLVEWATQTGAVVDRPALERCLGDDSTVPWAALGDQGVCLWDYGDSSSICANADADHPCPRVVFGVAVGANPDTVCAEFLPEDDMGVEPRAFLADETLRIFTIPPPPVETNPGQAANVLPCEALARLRSEGSGQDPYTGTPHTLWEDFAAIDRSGLFNQRLFQAWTRKLGWAPVAGGYSRVTYGNSTIATTGWFGAQQADLTIWPAGTVIGGIDVFQSGLCPLEAGFNDPGANQGSLFCMTGVDGVSAPGATVRPWARARANDALFRAVLAARVMSGVPLAEGDPILLPYYPRSVLAARVAGLNEDIQRTGFWSSREGTIQVDDTDDDGSGDEPAGEFLQEQAYSERADGSGWWEWVYCPYEGNDAHCRYFDSVDLQGDTDYVLPLIVRRIGAAVDVGNPSSAAAPLFRAGDGGLGWTYQTFISVLAGSYSYAERSAPMHAFGDVPLSSLTNYFVSDLQWRNGDFGHTCLDHHVGCIAQHPEVDFRSSVEGNDAYSSGPENGLTLTDVLNGLELTCAAARIDSEDPGVGGCGDTPVIRSVRDLLQIEAFLRCQADNLEARAGASVTANVPRRVVESLRNGGPSVSGESAGEIAGQVGDLGTAYEQLKRAPEQMAVVLRELAGAIRALRSEVAQSEIAHLVEGLSLQSQIFGHVTACVAAIGDAVAGSTSVQGGVGGALSAAATCTNSIRQATFAGEISSLRDDAERQRLQGVFGNFDRDVAGHLGTMNEIGIGIRADVSAIDGALSRLNGVRGEARRALARALYLESDDTGALFAASRVYRERYNTVLARYLEAHRRAIRTAYIARRAVETRIAMPLESITQDLVTVGAPSTWADEVCTLSTIDYDEVSGRSSTSDAGVGDDAEDGYAGAYVGDYISRLEQVVESYNFAFPFRDGTDTVVVSLRDDVFQSRAPCDVPVPNLVLQSDHLDLLAFGARPGWTQDGCDPDFVPAAGASAHCVSARRLTDADDAHDALVRRTMPELGAGSELGMVNGFRVHFGGSVATTSAVALNQQLTVPEGRYRVSWYGHRSIGTGGVLFDPALAVTVVDEAGDSLIVADIVATVDVDSPTTFDSGWARYHAFFDVGRSGVASIRIEPGYTSSEVSERFVDLAGVMVEAVGSTVAGNPWRSIPNPAGVGSMPVTVRLGDALGPGPYWATAETRTRVVTTCRDETGAAFRAEAWRPGCSRVCPDGYDSNCDDRIASSRCYYETILPINSSRLEHLLTGTATGFASGNYNYRIENVALNVVGTGIRDCTSSGSGCYGSGNIPYALLHSGRFTVVNARGESYFARLFPGRINTARALAAERYLTNPISSADAALITPLTVSDFRGRPLGGALTLRIWDEPGLNFDRVEDVQMVISYRYWQHQR